MLRLPHNAFFPGAALAEGRHGALLVVPAEIEVGRPERHGEHGDEEFEGILVHAEEEDAVVKAVVVAGCEEEGVWGSGVVRGWEEDGEGEEGVDYEGCVSGLPPAELRVSTESVV